MKRSRSKGGLAGPDGMKSVFGQLCNKIGLFGPDSLMLPHRVWKVKFIGECIAYIIILEMVSCCLCCMHTLSFHLLGILSLVLRHVFFSFAFYIK